MDYFLFFRFMRDVAQEICGALQKGGRGDSAMEPLEGAIFKIF